MPLRDAFVQIAIIAWLIPALAVLNDYRGKSDRE